jgi:hypothetical protein
MTNYNFLSQLGFKLVIHRLEAIEYLVQKVNLPGLNLGFATRFTPFAQDPRSGDLTFNDFQISFKFDKELKSYLSIWNWMTALGFPQNFGQYKELMEKNPLFANFEEGEITSDITLMVLDNKHIPIFKCVFISCFPIALSDLQLNSTDTDVMYLTADTTFKYTYYTIKPYPGSCNTSN